MKSIAVTLLLLSRGKAVCPSGLIGVALIRSVTHTLKGCEASAGIVLQSLHLYAHKKPGYLEQ